MSLSIRSRISKLQNWSKSMSVKIQQHRMYKHDGALDLSEVILMRKYEISTWAARNSSVPCEHRTTYFTFQYSKVKTTGWWTFDSKFHPVKGQERPNSLNKWRRRPWNKGCELFLVKVIVYCETNKLTGPYMWFNYSYLSLWYKISYHTLW